MLALLAWAGAAGADRVKPRWGLPEVVGFEQQLRRAIHRQLAESVGKPFIEDRDILRSWCDRIRQMAAGTSLRCALVFADGTAHFLVEPVPRRAASEPAPDRPDYIVPAFLIALRDRFMGRVAAAVNSGNDPGERLQKGIPRFRLPELDEASVALHRAVAPNVEPLLATLQRSSDASARADAAFLLQWSGQLRAVASAAIEALNDGDEGVRNNVARLLALTAADMTAVQRRRAALAWCRQLQWPTYTDRNKAVAGLAALDARTLHAVDVSCRSRVQTVADETSVAGMRALAQRVLRHLSAATARSEP